MPSRPSQASAQVQHLDTTRHARVRPNCSGVSWRLQTRYTVIVLMGLREEALERTDMQRGSSESETVQAGVGLSAAQLANQARLRCREAVAKFYDGSLVSDDELHPITTRNICLRTQVRRTSQDCPSPNVRDTLCLHCLGDTMLVLRTCSVSHGYQVLQRVQVRHSSENMIAAEGMHSNLERTIRTSDTCLACRGSA